jgi:hypothetical protein
MEIGNIRLTQVASIEARKGRRRIWDDPETVKRALSIVSDFQSIQHKIPTVLPVSRKLNLDFQTTWKLLAYMHGEGLVHLVKSTSGWLILLNDRNGLGVDAPKPASLTPSRPSEEVRREAT